MRTLVISPVFFVLALLSRAQDLVIPASSTQTTTDIAAYISSRCPTDQEKIRAIYSWVTSSIQYDADSIHRVILDEDNDQRVTYALKRRKGVCENFAAIFTDICLKAGIPSYAIEGYTRQSGSVDRTPHVWCAALVDDRWSLYDPTWDAGSIRKGSYVRQADENYFQKPPGLFISSHMPFDKLFQFLEHPVTYRQFARGEGGSSDGPSYFNYADSIKAYRESPPLDRYLSSVERMNSSQWPGSLIGTKLKRVALEIELIRQDEDMKGYHSAIADYNEAIVSLNEFLGYRNNQFLPARKEEEILAWFSLIAQKISAAKQELKLVERSAATLTLDTGGIREKLDEVAAKSKEQEQYYKDYIAAGGHR